MKFSNNCAQGEGSKCICWKAVRRKRAQREGREEAFESEKGGQRDALNEESLSGILSLWNFQTTAHKAKAANVFAGKPCAGSGLNEKAAKRPSSLKRGQRDALNEESLSGILSL